MEKDKKNELNISVLLILFLIFTETPYSWQKIATIRVLFIIGRFLGTAIVTVIYLKGKKKWKCFDVLTLLFCGIIFISALHAGFSPQIALYSPFTYLHGAYSSTIIIIRYLLVVKIAFDSEEKICLMMMKTIYGYYVVLCLINIATQIMDWKSQENENIFFLGLDNVMGKYYLFAFFYGCVVMVLEEKKFSQRLFFLTILTMFGGFYRRIGVIFAISLLMLVLVLLFFLAPKSKMWNLRQDLLLGSMMGVYMIVMGLYAKLDVLQVFINRYLFGKANSLSVRFALQATFLTKWLQSPFWGWANILGRKEKKDIAVFEFWLSAGHTHNYFVEVLYNFGIFALLIYVVLLLLGIRKIKGYELVVSFTGMAFLLVLLRGMFENACWDIFVVLPTVYYLGVWCEKNMPSSQINIGNKLKEMKSHFITGNEKNADNKSIY